MFVCDRYNLLYFTQHTSTHICLFVTGTTFSMSHTSTNICLFGTGTTFSMSLTSPQLTYVCLWQVQPSLCHSTHLYSHMFVCDRYNLLHVTQHTSTHICLFGTGTTFSMSLNTPHIRYVCLGQVQVCLCHSTHLISDMFVWDRYKFVYVTQHTSYQIPSQCNLTPLNSHTCDRCYTELTCKQSVQSSSADYVYIWLQPPKKGGW